MKYINEKKVAILMATYNGEKYIAAQIESIVEQSFNDWTLYIRDDGSSDKTIDIIRKYSNQYRSIILIEDDIFRKGASENFFSLLCMVESKYYMFSDQDDIWLSHKVESAYSQIQKLESENTNVPIVVGSDLQVVDSLLNPISTSFWKYCKIKVSLLHKFKYVAVCNGLAGCTMIFNNKVKEIIIPYLPTGSMHDYLITLAVTAKGGMIEYMNEAPILYRQHTNNVVGAQLLNGLHWFSKLKDLKTVYKQNVEQYRIACSIQHLSIAKYLWYKLLYTIKR